MSNAPVSQTPKPRAPFKASGPFSRAAITQMELMGYVIGPDGTVLKHPNEA
jgi:hypothetical protein